VIDLDDIYPLSPMQKGMLFHTLLTPETGVYFEQFCWGLRGELNAEALRRAWQHVADRHPVLRTSFDWEQLDRPMQLVHRRIEVTWDQQDWGPLSEMERRIRLQAFLEADRQRGFTLRHPPLFRLALFRTSGAVHYLVWSHHHLLLDGWSSSLLLAEVAVSYRAFCLGLEPELSPIRPYRDYIVWLQRQDLSRAEAYWRQALKGFQAPTPLPIGRAAGRMTGSEPDYDDEHIYLSPEATERLQAFAQRHHLTLQTLVQGAWAILLSRYGGEADVVFGTTASGRSPEIPGVESMIGLFINTLPTRVRVPGGEPLVAWLQRLQDEQAEARQFDYTPLAEIQTWSDVPRGMPLFETIFVFENEALERALQQQEGNRQEAGLEVVEFRAFERTNYPLTAGVAPGPHLFLGLTYERRRFEAGAIRRMLGHWRTLLEGMGAEPNVRLGDLPLLTDSERHTLLDEWNRTEADYPRDRCVHELFTAQATRTPEAVAVVFEQDHLTYQELNARANRLAHYLRRLGVRPEVCVGICLERSLEMVVGLLGVLKAGGVYVPLDPDYPPERLAWLVADSQVTVLLTQERLVGRLPRHGARLLCLDNLGPALATESSEDPASGVSPDNLIYVIYTSGSTGKPKGVLVEHRAAVNYITAAADELALGPADRMLQFSSISFDSAVDEIFTPLIRGARLVLRSPAMLESVPRFLRSCREMGVTNLDLPTSYWHDLASDAFLKDLASCDQLRVVYFGGERALPERLKAWRRCMAKSVRLVNGYGPTEATVVATLYDVSADSGTGHPMTEVPIGRPIRNMQAYVLDRHWNPTPVGVPGELYLGGVGLARGYLGRPELTAGKFLPNPFGGEPGARLYRTGDLARWLPDGNLEVLGRLDHQIKLRGFRVELGEIEAVLAEHPAVREAVVMVRDDGPGGKRLVAYVVPREESEVTSKQLRGFVQEKLPAHMSPAAFMLLKALPRTSTGKIDRQALPASERAGTAPEEAFVAPRDPVEDVLAGIWCEVLKVERVGVHDNFFELGGDSLLSLQVVARIRALLRVEIPLRAFFDTPTIAGLAGALRRDADRGADVDQVAAVVVSLARLSDAEVEAMLAARAP
jgi:amino acid adenylation domain-containing protein